MSATRVVRAAEGRRTPWKNGGGETVELAAHPPGAGLDGFEWRVSTALVAADGPFSAFPGVDRTLAVLTGEGMALAIDGAEAAALTPASDPFAFPADAPCAARLLDGPVRDLNVMTRRGRFTHAVRRLAVTGPVEVAGGDVTLVFCPSGGIAAGDLRLDPGDTLVTTESATLEPARPGETATVLAVVLRPA